MSTFGTLFKVTTYGESHCSSVGCIVEGTPPGLFLTQDIVQKQLSRRRPGQSDLTTPRNEADTVYLQSGIEFDTTLGTPIGMMVKNLDQRPHDYTETDLYPRPSHADYTYLKKYGVKASSGGGRASARETIGRVAAGAIAEHYLDQAFGTRIVAFVSAVGKIKLDVLDEQGQLDPKWLTLTREMVDKDLTRCPHKETSDLIHQVIVDARDKSDSVGGVVTCVIINPPIGLGEPCFDKLEAKLAHAMLSIPATKGFEIGSGFNGTTLLGSKHNDNFQPHPTQPDLLITETNRSGGIQGGISNGEPIYFSVAFKPAATISQPQATATYDGTQGELAARGRHDPCVLPRAVPIVEAMAAMTLMDQYLLQAGRSEAASKLPKRDIHPSLLGKLP